ncbi:peptidyl-prolyl cis-trans isomerase C [Microbulbifer donghaiensis]|uniref:peptidylprolyl isomerase n=1 Tax=Microbulbifer donghaiensis TaxID=494016 RepID=A0A1M5G9U0_9GAMM|nr:peptidylprolyl isomerase [Microbulbifer donghaiensis]SHG00489.1 peptidyl-prolyl cis-trans isomerase C [Microbulbifer donghaiensis]
MSKDGAIPYVEIPVNAAAGARSAPALPSACETGGCGCATPTRQAPPVLSFGRVRVNDVEITEDQIAREMQNHRAEDAATAWQSAARALVIKELLLQEATRQQVDAKPEQGTEDRIETEHDARVRALLERQLPPAAIFEEECRRYYDCHIHRFRTPDLFEAAHILIEPAEDNEIGWQEAERHARALAVELGDDEQRFAEAAKEFSRCPTSTQGGSLGQVRRGELDRALHDALETLSEGSTARQPVRSRFGWHLLRLQRKICGQTLPFELAREKIFDMLEARAWVNSASRYIVELGRRASIEGVQIEPLCMESENPDHE